MNRVALVLVVIIFLSLGAYFFLTRENESTHDLAVGVSSLDRTSSDSGKPATLQSGFYRDKTTPISLPQGEVCDPESLAC